MSKPSHNLPSTKLFLYSLPFIFGFVIFVIYKNSQITVINSTGQNQLAAAVSSGDSAQTNNVQGTENTPVAQTNESTTTVTGQVAMNLFANNLALQQSGADNPNNLQNLAMNTANGILSPTAKDVYTESDLKIIPINSGTGTLLSFANKTLLVSNQISQQLNSLDIANKLSDPSSPDFSKTMSAVSDLYYTFAKNLASIAVPQEIEKSYLLLINSYAHSAQDYASASLGETDPLPAMVAMGNIKNDEADQQTVAQTLGNYLQSHGVVYSSNLNAYTQANK